MGIAKYYNTFKLENTLKQLKKWVFLCVLIEKETQDVLLKKKCKQYTVWVSIYVKTKQTNQYIDEMRLRQKHGKQRCWWRGLHFFTLCKSPMIEFYEIIQPLLCTLNKFKFRSHDRINSQENLFKKTKSIHLKASHFSKHLTSKIPLQNFCNFYNLMSFHFKK